MKKILVFSLMANVFWLAGSVCFFIRQPPTTPADPPAGSTGPWAAAQAKPSPAAEASHQQTKAAPAKPFAWSQLESGDYRTYVSNLRDIGCPEATLRAIVSADVEAAFRKRTDELKFKLAEFEKLSWAQKLQSAHEREGLLAALRQLPQTKAAAIDAWLGLPSPAISNISKSDSVTGTTLSARDHAGELSTGSDTPPTVTAPPPTQSTVAFLAQAQKPENLSTDDTVSSPKNLTAPELPVIFKSVDPAVLNLDDQQKQIVAELRQTFVDEIGGLDQDTTSPDYLQRWLKAQTDVNNLAKGLLGLYPWETYQLATWQP